MMDVITLRREFKNYIIKRGLKSVRSIRDEEKRKGAIEGFEMCKTLNDLKEFEKVYKDLRDKTLKIALISNNPKGYKEYWRLVYKAEQVNFVYQRLKVFDLLFGLLWKKVSISARAMIDTIKILNEIFHVDLTKLNM